MDLVEKLVVGPAPLRASQMEQMLGINPDLLSRASSTGTTRIGKREKISESEDLDLNEFRSRRIRATRVDLLEQFQIFSKFGNSTSDGSQITLTQSDKWLRQAKVIDGWNVTTTDTAIAFRKISRGSIWLSFSHFREFLEELISRKGLNIQEVRFLYDCFKT